MNTELMMQNLTKGDPDAFQQFYDRYSLPVYHYIMDKTGDPERTRQLWRDTFRGLLSMLRCSDPPDLPFLLLTALADRQLENVRPAPPVTEIAADKPVPDRPAPPAAPDAPIPAPDVNASPTSGDILPPSAPTSVPNPVNEPSAASDAVSVLSVHDPAAHTVADRRAGLIVLLVVLILLGAFALWTATGYLMALDVLPAYDLGYSWFNRVFFRLFPSSFP